jgi:hypothetical protein
MWSSMWMEEPDRLRPAAPPRPSPTELVLARARHPSFTSEQAASLVRTLSRRQLRKLWAATGAQLEEPLPDTTRLHLVLLREQLLLRYDELGHRRPAS